MKFSLERSGGLSIHGYASGEVTILIPQDHPLYENADKTEQATLGLARITESFILTSNELLIEWPPATLEQLTLAHFDTVLALEPELVLLGTGASLRFPDYKIITHLNQQGIGMEVMDTQAACRTFNVLTSEGRHVAAALMMS